MEEPGGAGGESVAQSPAGAGKSKLDTLSKDDLIKFAKKQMAGMQKMKSKCAELEKEVESLKQRPPNQISNPDDSVLIQELTEKMDALLLEKAEIQQSFALSRKDLEKNKKQAKDDLDALQGELDRITRDQQSQIEALDSQIQQSNHKHQEEVAFFQKLLKEREESDRQRESERDRLTELASAKESSEEVCRGLEAQLEALRTQLETIQEQRSQEIVEGQDGLQKELTDAHQEVENLKEELAQKSLQHEEEMRALEEDFEIERDRLLLLHEELTEQLALKDSYLQDVQEEEEDPARGSGIARMLELSGCSQGESNHGDGEETETRRLKAASEELQAQNTMLQDELTLLSNVKAELEAELERTREEFQTEKEELEFKINELQMNREGATSDATTSMDPEEPQESEAGTVAEHNQPGDSKEAEHIPADGEQQKLEELVTKCEALTTERDAALDECQHIQDIMQGFETELAQKTKDFVQQYNTMKEQSANTVQVLQDKLNKLSQERDKLLEEQSQSNEENKSLMADVQDLKVKLEVSAGMEQKLQSSVEEQTALACELKQTVEELMKHKEEILSQLQMKENVTEDLQDIVNTLTDERDKILSQLKNGEEQLQKLKQEGGQETEMLLEDKEKEAFLLRQENEGLKGMKKEREDEIDHLKDQNKKLEERLTEEVAKRQEMVSALEGTIKDLSTEKNHLCEDSEEASSALSKAMEEKELLATRLATLEAQLEKETSEKNLSEAKQSSLAEEAEQARAAVRTLEENQAEMLRNSKLDIEELQARVDELEKERSLLKESLEEAQGAVMSEEMQKELRAQITDLEQERDMVRNNLEGVLKDVEGLQKDLEDMKSVNERIHEENNNLRGQLSEMTQQMEQKEAVNTEEEMRELQEQLRERDSVISQMKTEVAAIQESAAQSASSEEKAAGEIAEKMALMEKELKDKDEKMIKIKAVAIKAKKELDISKKEVTTLREEVETLKADKERVNSSMKDIIHGAEGYKNLQIDYDRQTEQLDKEREKTEAAEKQVAELTKRLSGAVTQNEAMGSEKEDLLTGMETLRNALKQLEAHNQDLQRQLASLDKDLLAERAMKEQKIKDLSSAMKEVEGLTAQLRKQQQQSQQTAQELEQLRKGAQQSSLLDMEMADYERLVKELNAKLQGRDECAEELKAQINTLTQKEDTLKQEIEVLKSQLDQGEEKTSKMKQLLVKTKKDLADAKKQESSLLVQQASLKGELEGNQQQVENFKIEMSELTAERHRLQEQLRSATEQQQRTNSSLQQRITALQQERDAVQAELATTTAEFESYKVRVHNVLKQQKSKTTAQSDGDAGKIEREQLVSQVEKLKAKLTENHQSLQSSAMELQQLQVEHDTLLERHNKILQETISKEAELRERLLSVQSDNVTLRSDLSEAQTDLSSQIETQRQTYREQLRKLQDDHRATVETLQGQLTRVEEQLFNLQSQNSSVSVQSARKSLASELQRRGTDPNQAGVGLMMLSDLQSMAREEGEGMETTETETPSPTVRSLPSLEHLLTSPDPKQEPFVWTVEPTKEELSQKLNTATKSMAHMNRLLHETEATNAVLMEQITLLKSELRRLERNQEREKSVANLEYLKNVLLQFIFLQSGSERQALLPVIHTMLQLSPEEKAKLAAIAQGEQEASGNRGSGWTSYLHSWSGIR